MIRWIVGSAIIAAMGLSPAWAEAQASDAAMKEAQKLYQDAAKDMDTQDYARACPKLEAARKILPEHVRTAISLAECYDKLGEPATSLEAYNAARALAHTQKNTDKLAEIDTKLAALKPRVPHLTISVSKNVAMTPGLTISRNNVPVPVGQWGKSVALNPGKYQIEVTAVDKAPWNVTQEINMGQNATVQIKPPWSAEANDDTGTAGAVSNGKSVAPLRIAGIIGISVGVVGLGVGAFLGTQALTTNAASNMGHCNDRNICDRVGYDLRLQARSLGNGSTAMLVVGGVLATTGVVLVVVGGKNKNPNDNGQTSLWLGPTSVGVAGNW